MFFCAIPAHLQTPRIREFLTEDSIHGHLLISKEDLPQLITLPRNANLSAWEICSLSTVNGGRKAIFPLKGATNL